VAFLAFCRVSPSTIRLPKEQREQEIEIGKRGKRGGEREREKVRDGERENEGGRKRNNREWLDGSNVRW
jgi:hypothetical protein